MGNCLSKKKKSSGITSEEWYLPLEEYSATTASEKRREEHEEENLASTASEKWLEEREDLESLTVYNCMKIMMLDGKSDLVVNSCANCLKSFRLRKSLKEPRLYQMSCHVRVSEDIELEDQLLYRVLKEYDDTSYGLTAKNEFGSKSVKKHVALGSGKNFKSQYISTCTTLEKAMEFADKGINKGNPFPKRIVEINVSLLPTNIFIDFSKPETCEALFRNPTDGMGQMAYNFANKDKEVLVVGSIPSDAITAKYKMWSVESELEPYD